MIPQAFDYLRADTLDAALAAIAEHGDDAKLMAGGHSLVPLMKLRLAAPAVVVDIGRLGELSYITDGGDHLAIGALTSHNMLERSELLAVELPLLSHAAHQVGDPQVRNRGTLGGSLAHGDSASDLAAVALACDATIVAVGPQGERTIAATTFFEGFLETALADDELLTEIRFPKAPDAGWAFEKFVRRSQDWAIVGVAALCNGSTGIGLVNMASTPIRAAAAEAAVDSGASAAQAAELAAEGTAPNADNQASIAYREHLARVLVRRALRTAGVA